MRFVNLHTHRKPQVQGEWCVRNGYTGAGYSPDDLPYSISLGIHPWHIEESGEKQLQVLSAKVKHKNVVAIGECGLDRLRGPEMKLQKMLFEAQIDLANSIQKPMIFHLVRSYSDFLEFTRQIQVPWVIHGFQGNLTEVRKMLDKGGSVSFGYRLFMNDSLHETLRYVPNDRLYLETDVRALKIDAVYRHVASIKGIHLDLLQEALWSNARRDFKGSPLLPA